MVKRGGATSELQDLLRIAGIGLVLGLLHIFFEQTGKKEFSFFLNFIAYLYITIELLRFLRLFFDEIITFFQWLMTS
ncbi:stage III sporulation protein AC [Rummeliibacillus sp. G93]|uniref:Stage III sporulation protein AC n=1 Tax=Rummeliibacillus stabekisii TaxID=241244 RepID=A0A143HAV2_9BACL|nr:MULTISPECIES: SpoIIIAC/SpoIIIAD family protein [Rummeliibacillus]AMW98838.1 stage III sporulation protein AC [Rummeliibacillus stabekisii]MCM3316244.1 stage III sporulation protein AC [Rummeliibacillus stabekisii]UQW99008.1 stage III sporulation protein AC [Rummeliibacillus sp. G93]